jgi:hypothetical protein
MVFDLDRPRPVVLFLFYKAYLVGIEKEMSPVAPQIALKRPTLFGDCAVTAAVGVLAEAGIEERGAVFTRREVVDFILDLSGYTTDRPLHELRLLEPSFGGGEFLLSATGRLLEAWRRAGAPEPVKALSNAIRAVELHRDSFAGTRTKLLAFLEQAGLAPDTAKTLARHWLVFGDYLLAELDGQFDAVVGNPPYVRQELIADALMAEYRARYSTIYDRADIYVPFIERSLSALKPKGKLGFICADRWMKNKYGGPLRKLVAENYQLEIYVDMVDTPTFDSEVIAYPAIVVITPEKTGLTRIARRPAIDRDTLKRLAADLVTPASAPADRQVEVFKGVANGAEPWLLDSSGQLALVRRLESAFPPIEDAGCKVGIGVATGADKAFIGRFEELDVEDDRKLPLVMTRDILTGVVEWRGLGVVNPFADDGKLVALEKYPRLARYLESRRDDIAGRHVAQKIPANWYRTIDRIYPELAGRPKLLIPDIKGEAHIVYEHQGLYPHHNLYYIASDSWDLKALQAVLLSGIARLFVAAYSTKMRGGYLRFQAQYLRRIRLPRWHDVSAALREKLAFAADSQNKAACDAAVAELYRLSASERAALAGNGSRGD